MRQKNKIEEHKGRVESKQTNTKESRNKIKEHKGRIRKNIEQRKGKE